MSAPALAVVVIAASLWPFGRGGEERRAEPTLRSLEAPAVEIREDQPLPEAGEAAREQYRRFLALGEGDEAMTAEALRRLGDLALELEEEAALGLLSEALDGEGHAEAIALYEERLARFPSHPDNDLVRYQLARAQELGGDRMAALATLDDLIARHPDSALADEVQFRRGELLFSRGRYREAEQAYAAVLDTRPASDFVVQAAYKHGWALFKQGLLPETLQAFFDLLVSRSHAGIDGLDALGRQQRELLEDVLRVMALSLAGLEGIDTLHALLAEQPARAAWAAETHRSLGALYLEQERYTDTAAVMSAFVTWDPVHAEAPALALEGMAALRRGGFAGLLLTAKEDFVERFGLATEYWRDHRPVDQPETVAALGSALTTLAQHAHAQSQLPEPPPGALGEAIHWYGLLLEYFPDDEAAPTHHFLFAELLLEAGDVDGAIRAFDATAYGYPVHPRSAEAAYAGLLARDRMTAALAEPPRPVALERIAAAERFSRNFSEHPEALDVLTDAAERAFALDDPPLALRLAREVTASVPSPPAALARVAWRIQGHVLFDLMAHAEAESAYWAVHGLLDTADAAGRMEVEERLAASIYRQGEAARERGEYVVAAGHFLRVGARLPEAGIRPVAEFDAGIAYLSAGDWNAAVDVLVGFRDRYPDHALASQVEINLASAYEALDNPGAAAAEYRRMAARLPNNEEQRGLLWRAAELLEQAGQTAATEAVLVQITRDHAQAFDEAVEAHQQLIDLADARGDEAGALERSRRLVSFESAGPVTPRTRTLAARAALRLADVDAAAFHATMLVVPLTDSLRLKRRRMETALEGYAMAAAYAVDEVVTAATFATAELYHGLARALMASPRPAELDALALDQYEMLLEEQAFPFEEQAIAIHERNAQRTVDGLYDRWIAASFSQLAELMPGRYAKAEQGETHVARLY